jgi:two-component system copper resistance phosphate regulon response regulator CusR
MQILLIEDSPKMALAMQRGLAEHGYQVTVTHSGREGEEQAIAEPFALLILDLMLPDHDGIDLCRNLRRRGCKTPVLMLTALSSTKDKVEGLNAGADDYLTKPFEFEELLARVRALLRRGTETESAVLRYADVELDLVKRKVTRAGKPISLTHKEFTFLEYLMRNPDRVLSRAMIGSNVWDMNFDAFSNVIDVYVSNLRRKVDKPFDSPLLHTVVGSGYVFSQTPPNEGAAA